MRIWLREMWAFGEFRAREVDPADTLDAAIDAAIERGTEWYTPILGEWSTEVIYTAEELDDNGEATGNFLHCQKIFDPDEPPCIDDSGHTWELASARKDDDREIREDRCSRCHAKRKIDTKHRNMGAPYNAIRYEKEKP